MALAQRVGDGGEGETAYAGRQNEYGTAAVGSVAATAARPYTLISLKRETAPGPCMHAFLFCFFVWTLPQQAHF